ncbi:MAG TPA: SUMF1/EgtB/PvdO family nonheme iron enzyme, partial [Anaerolineaceae bacterium]|nr:SUMF1/EgtB/PvdO family nonheme iron enzyme [Anaerolineaceae bacterium]
MGDILGYGEGDFDDQKPLHTIFLNAYWIDQTEVTNVMYEQCVNTGSCSKPQSDTVLIDTSYYGNPLFADYPAVEITWDESQAYCAWAGRT